MNRLLLAVVAALVLVAPAAAQDMPLSQILIPGEDWKPVSAGALPGPPLPVLPGKTIRFTAGTGHGPSYFTVRGDPAVYVRNGDSAPRRLELPLAEPTGVALWRDGGTLVVADAGGKYLWAFRVEKDGSLSAGEPYYPLWLRPRRKRSEVAELTMDQAGRLYAATPDGVQVFDTTGRLSGILDKPAAGPMTRVAFDGPEGTLVVDCGGKLYARRLNAKGARPQ